MKCLNVCGTSAAWLASLTAVFMSIHKESFSTGCESCSGFQKVWFIK